MLKREVMEGSRGGGGGNAGGLPFSRRAHLRRSSRKEKREAVEEGMERRESLEGTVRETLQVCLSHQRAQIV